MKVISAIFWIIADFNFSSAYKLAMFFGLYLKWLDRLQAFAYKRRYYASRRIANE